MIILPEPALEGLAARRISGFARRMPDRRAAGDSKRFGDLAEAEASLAPELRELEGRSADDTACVRGLGVLAQPRWQLGKCGHGRNSIGLNRGPASTVEQVERLDVQ